MTDDEIRSTVLKALATVAPEARSLPLEGDVPLRDQLDLDSMDFLNVLIALHKTLQVEIPEADYGAFATLDGAVRYLAERITPRP